MLNRTICGWGRPVPGFLLLLLLFFGAGRLDARLEWIQQPQNTAVRLGDDFTVPCLAAWVNDGTSGSLGVVQSQSSSSSSLSFSPSSNAPAVDSVGSGSSAPSQPTALKYTWALNPGPIAEKATKLPDHSLFVPRASESDLGSYTCTVSAHFEGSEDDIVELVAPALVVLASLQPFVIHPKSQAVSVGDTATLTCVTGVSSPVVEVTWLWNGLEFTKGSVQSATFGSYDPTGLSHQLSVRLTVQVSSDVFGIFQCRAWNPVLQDFVLSEMAGLSNKVKPSSDLPVILWSQPPSLVVGEGHALVLPCKSTDSTEPAKISWYLGQYLVDESKRVYALLDTDQSLGFFPVQRQDTGQYSCRAENSKGIVESPPLDLVVAYLEIEFAVNPVDTFAVYGTTAVLHCEPPGSIPVAQVFWYKDYLPLNVHDNDKEGRMSIVGQGDLQLTSVEKSDNGLYYCEAYNNFTTPTSRTSKLAHLKVKGPPIMNVPPTAAEIVKGTLVHLKCMVDADPTPVVTWLFEGQAISAGSSVTLVNRSQELVITGVGKSWEGWFTCKAHNSYGSISADAYVTVIVPPESLRAIGDIVVTAGQPILIPCPVLSDPMPDIIWFHNDIQIYPKDLGAPTSLQWSVVLPNLHLENIVPENAGNYTCVGMNKGGTASSSGFLVVYVPPSISLSPQNTAAVIGQSVTLTCKTKGHPDPSTSWLYNTSMDLPSEAELSEDNSTLTLTPFAWTSVGVYTCVAENIVGQAHAQAEVRAMTVPKVTVLESPENAVKVNTRVTLKCKAEGIPPPLITWTHQDQPVLPSLNGRVRLSERGVLVLEIALLEDSGQYECVGTSQAGEDTAAMTLSVYGPPPPPVVMSAVPLSSESVYLLWKWSGPSSDPQQIVDGFRVWYRQKQSETPILYPATLKINSTRVEVTGLKPHQEYVFYLIAYGESGTSGPSNLISAITLQSEPATPENLRTIAVYKTKATLTWEVPLVPNGVVRQYRLQYKRLGDIYDDYTVLNITHPDFPTHEIVLAGLRPYTQYTAEVRAANIQSGSILWGEFSPPLTFWTQMAEPSHPPQFVEIAPLSPYSIQITWQPVPTLAQNGPVLFYHITYTNTKSGESDTRRVSQDITTLTVFGLSPWREYSVTVKGENPKGFSPASPPVTALTLPIAPVATPGNFKVDLSSASSLTLSWEALPDILLTCEITAYKVEYRQNGHSKWLTKNVASESLRVQLDFLESWTWYEVRVAAVTSSLTPGIGPFTEPALNRTQQGASGAVTAVSFSLGETNITLSWQPPKELHGILAGYKVSYQSLNEAKPTTVPRDILVYSNRSLTLSDLDPDVLYELSICAINGAGPGRETVLRLRTLPAPLPDISLTTEYAVYNVSSEETKFFNDSEINFSESSTSRHIRRNLAAIVAGCLVGAVALTVCTIFVCIQCIKYRRKQRLNYDVSEDRVIIETDSGFYRPNESSPPVVEFISSTKPSLPFFTSSSSAQPPPPPSSSAPSSQLQSPSSKGPTSTQKWQQPSLHAYQTQSQTSLTPPENTSQETGINKNQPDNINDTNRSDTTTNSGTTAGKNTHPEVQVIKTTGQDDTYAVVLRTNKSDLPKKGRSSGESSPVPISGSKKYSKLDEDMDGLAEVTSGLENPMYEASHGEPATDVDDIILMVDDSLSSFSNSRLTHSVKSFDTDSIADSVTSETMRRRNRMRTESAAAIAAMRSTIYVDSLDMAADNSNGIGMLGNAGHISRNIVPEPEVEVEDFGSEVIFNERTVL